MSLLSDFVFGASSPLLSCRVACVETTTSFCISNVFAPFTRLLFWVHLWFRTREGNQLYWGVCIDTRLTLACQLQANWKEKQQRLQQFLPHCVQTPWRQLSFKVVVGVPLEAHGRHYIAPMFRLLLISLAQSLPLLESHECVHRRDYRPRLGLHLLRFFRKFSSQDISIRCPSQVLH